MATRRSTTPQEVGPIRDVDIGDFVTGAMTVYGVSVNEERAVAAIQDGLKPVARRILYAALAVAAKSKVKTARLSGSVIGLYHAHGDASVNAAVATQVNAEVPPLTGIGNWGTLVDPPAAARYTNVILNDYGLSFLQKDYLAVTPMTANFDDTTTEPIVLPALLPNILLNSTYGIGVGLTTGVPSFTMKSLLGVCIRLLDGEKLKAEDFAAALKFYNTWGATAVRSAKNKEAILALMKTSSASIEFMGKVDIDEAKKQVLLQRFPPGLDFDRLLNTLRVLPGVKSVYAGKGLSFIVQLDRAVNATQVQEIAAKIQTMLTKKESYSIYITDRVALPDDEAGNTGLYRVDFHRLSVPQVIRRWLSYRVNLEIRVLEYRIGQTEKRRAHLLLLMHAAKPTNLKIIFDALRKPNTRDLIASGLNITVEEADTILSLQVRRLSSLDQDSVRKEVDELDTLLKTYTKDLKYPRRPVKAYLEATLAKLVVAPRDPLNYNCLQQWLGAPGA